MMMQETKQETKPKPVKGAMFYTSWGYDQTNYDFIVVKSISPTGKTALCQMAEVQDVDDTSRVHDGLQPVPKGYGDTFRMRITPDGHLRGSYPYCDGKMETGKRLDWFYPVKEGKTYYQTNSMFGH